MNHYLLTGLVLGLSAGLAPGPLLTLVVSETLAHDLRAGIRVALAPLITDLPIVTASVFLLSRLGDLNPVLGGISMVGSLVILKMGYGNLKIQGVTLDGDGTGAKSLRRGIAVNFLSPHPYVFWITVGAPLVSRAWADQPSHGVWFIISFYLLLVGSKVGLAVLAAGSKSFLQGKIYIYTMKTLGLMLCCLGLGLAWEALVLWGILA